ncbi:MAG TPA: DUF3299 domain-containing protein [Luteibacter sp.]|nr:DUF3299 domain-containing protein [Luteibacter sp.]
MKRVATACLLGLLAACSGSKAPATQTDLQRAQAAADAGRTARAEGKAANVPEHGDLVGLPDRDGYNELDWTHMLPKEDLAILKDSPPVVHVGNRQGPQIGTLHTVPGLAGQRVRLTGYVVPLNTDANGDMTEFFFVPFYGACIHVPPPPPNMLIHVRLDKAIPTPQIWDPFWLRGTLRISIEHNAIAASAYSMADAQLVPYADPNATTDDRFE